VSNRISLKRISKIKDIKDLEQLTRESEEMFNKKLEEQEQLINEMSK